MNRADPDQAPTLTPMTEIPVKARLVRTGGLAGMTQDRRFRLTDLDPLDAEMWEQLLVSGVLAELGSGRPSPDRHIYRVVAEGLDATVGEADVAESVRDLFDRTLKRD